MTINYMRKNAIAVVGLVAGSVLLLGGVTPALAADPAPKGPFPTADESWSVGAQNTGSGVVAAAGWGLEGCVGTFQVMEYVSSSNDFFWGGIQQCVPNPADQHLTIDLYRVVGTGDFEHTEYVHQDSNSGVTFTLPVHPYRGCSSHTSTRYEQVAYGTVNGSYMTPWPARSSVVTVGCYVATYN